ncbi:MAG: HAMP domain-containing protein [Chlorobiaceae bacterium]|nr:HAMP domain-containing protein [Chlorobiaceae bacterium]
MKTEVKHALKNTSILLKKWTRMSLRNRIALYYTIATAILVALVFTILFFMVERMVYKQFDDEVNNEVTEVFTDAHVTSHDFTSFSRFKHCIDDKEINSNETEHKEKETSKVDTEFIQLVNIQGQVINKSVNLGRNVLIFKPNQTKTIYFNSTINNSTIRQGQLPLFNRDGIIKGYLIVAVPMKKAIIVLNDLQNVFLFSFPGIIVTLFVLTRLIAGKSIRPIEKVIATAEKMTQTNLNHRIELPYHQDELYRLSVTINALLDRMQEAFQREKQFTADASHELKTPLAVVKGTLEVLVRKPREKEHYETKIQFCLKEINRMARLIDQLLLLARYESNKMNPHREGVILSVALDSVTVRLQPIALEKEIKFKVEGKERATVTTDPAMLEIILENILSNAIKYSPAGSLITISVEQKEKYIICSITDQGIGIPEEKLNAVFERFYRVDESRNSSTGGFGLGLSIVKRLADLQQIKISVDSIKNIGTKFALIFPSSTPVNPVPQKRMTA